MLDYVNKTLLCTFNNTEIIRHDRTYTNTKVFKVSQYDFGNIETTKIEQWPSFKAHRRNGLRGRPKRKVPLATR